MAPVAPFGRWPSPFSVEQAAGHKVSVSGLWSDGTALYWLASRPEEGGRTALFSARPGAEATEVSPPGANLRSRVHEYGGGAVCLAGPRAPGAAHAPFAAVDQADQRVRLHRPGAAALDLSPAPPEGVRWSHGGLAAPADGSVVLAVRETAGEGGGARDLVAYDPAQPGRTHVLAAGRDFYGAPAVDRAGGRAAFTCWDHPDMPWDGAELWAGRLERQAGRVALVDLAPVAGGGGVSAGQPTWCAGGDLAYVADPEGWWQPWCRPARGGPPRRLCALEADFQRPAWVLSEVSLVELAPGTLGCRFRHRGRDQVARLGLSGGEPAVVDQPAVSVGDLCPHAGGLAWLGRTWERPTGVWLAPAEGRPGPAVPPPPAPLGPGDVSAGEPFSAPGDAGRSVEGLFYPPANASVTGPADRRPPLVVTCHGGPTSAVEPGFDPVVQYFTTRGFAVAAVDYAGSSGHGRQARRALWGRWGEADADDCVAAARHLAAQGRVDGGAMAIRGSSAGGLTALNALVRGRTFAAATSWYGVTDLLALAAATHEFEARYLDRLVGPLPEARAEYERRSPVHRVADLEGAVLLLQGADDPVVPLGQAEAMFEALRARGSRVALVVYEGESHGFRRAETVRRSLQAELDFYLDVLLPGPDPGPR
jgi:dipeptidyl aminopeptidase/acylaminoacyl peptidase